MNSIDKLFEKYKIVNDLNFDYHIKFKNYKLKLIYYPTHVNISMRIFQPDSNSYDVLEDLDLENYTYNYYYNFEKLIIYFLNKYIPAYLRRLKYKELYDI